MNLCTDASRQSIRLCAYDLGMSNTPSDRVAEHRQRIAEYIRLVMAERAWSQAAVARALNVNQSTMNRAANGKHTTSFESLLALEEAAGVAMPEELKASAKALRQPTRPAPANEDVRDLVELVGGAPIEEQRALFEQLSRKFGSHN